MGALRPHGQESGWKREGNPIMKERMKRMKKKKKEKLRELT
jgi:hypothetical protein